MIDAQVFGAELASIVKAATGPLIARINDLEKRLAGVHNHPCGPTEEQVTALIAAAEDRAKAHADTAMEKIAETVNDGQSEVMAVDDIKEFIAESVSSAVADLPDPTPGEDGKSVSLDDVVPLIDAAVAKAVAALPPAKDGVGLAGCMIDRGGNLVLTLTNGEVKGLGVIVGKDGAAGKDGVDGLGFDDLEFVTDDLGRAVAKFRRGDVVKSIVLPGIVDRGPYRSGETYQKGDAVSYGGSLWIAQDETFEKPDGGSGWRLAIKKGRDGKDGSIKPAGGK